MPASIILIILLTAFCKINMLIFSFFFFFFFFFFVLRKRAERNRRLRHDEADISMQRISLRVYVMLMDTAKR